MALGTVVLAVLSLIDFNTRLVQARWYAGIIVASIGLAWWTWKKQAGAVLRTITLLVLAGTVAFCLANLMYP